MDYHDEENQKLVKKLRELLLEMPDFCGEYFRSTAQKNNERTRLGYAYDLRLFFTFLVSECSEFSNKSIDTLTISDLEKITPSIIDEFLDYLTYYSKQNLNGDYSDYENHEKGKSRKLAAVRSLLKYFYKREKISSNPAQLIETPKIHDKNIIRLEVDEVAKLLDNIESGDGLSNGSAKYHSITKLRDLALITLLLGTGMRVSECVGIDINHIDFNINGIKITRKGGNEAVIYFGDEVEEALKLYLAQRQQVTPLEGHENALFLSIQNRRITVRAVQNLVKKYAQTTTTLKNISPHKLRSTYGTTLYQETGDIYLVADVLGHKDVNTTKKHYAQMQDNNRRSAARAVRLREK